LEAAPLCSKLALTGHREWEVCCRSCCAKCKARQKPACLWRLLTS